MNLPTRCLQTVMGGLSMIEPKVHHLDVDSHVWRHVYESFFNCDYDGPVWTGFMRFDLKVIKAMPVLYPEQVRESGLFSE